MTQLKDVPELKDVLSKFSCQVGESPQYAITGYYESATLATSVLFLVWAQNEFWAHLIAREVRKSGTCDLMRTEFHPSGDAQYSIATHLRTRAKRETEEPRLRAVWATAMAEGGRDFAVHRLLEELMRGRRS